MNTKKLLLALLVTPTLFSAKPLQLPQSIEVPSELVGEYETISNLTGLNSVLQLLYNLPEIRTLIKTTTSKNPFAQAMAAFFKDTTNSDLYKKVYTQALNSTDFSDDKENIPQACIKQLFDKILLSNKQELYNLFLNKLRGVENLILYGSYINVPDTFKDITDQSKYLLFFVNQPDPTDKFDKQIDILKSKNNELVGFIAHYYTYYDNDSSNFLINTDTYITVFKDFDDNKWYIITAQGKVVSINTPARLKMMPNKNLLLSPVILVYKKVEDTFSDFAQALARI
ncbi:MAG: hypothetical protein UV38_C0002G0287 [candidate division TM6 bacterium GW2011_GWE2_42_60]|nr:MAG: hypothetical protein UV38_C0002G0287 [candidate division TM6 bacterium GW2011_GWE2_42_60]HBY05961.1 hypothetical protein [Candidatus Dependentiae bacterium]